MGDKPYGYWKDHYQEVADLLAKNKSYEQIGKEFGVTRSSISGVVSRYIRKRPDKRVRMGGNRGKAHDWQFKVTETWAERKKRREYERQQKTGTGKG